jgi:hypothetical protein
MTTVWKPVDCFERERTLKIKASEVIGLILLKSPTGTALLFIDSIHLRKSIFQYMSNTSTYNTNV